MGCKSSTDKGKLTTHAPLAGKISPSLVTLPDTEDMKRLQAALPDVLRSTAVSNDPTQREYGILAVRKGIASFVTALTPAQLTLLFQSAAAAIPNEDVRATAGKVFLSTSTLSVQDPTLVRGVQLWMTSPAAVRRSTAEIKKMLFQLCARNEDAVVSEVDSLPSSDGVDFAQYYQLFQRLAGREEFNALFEKYATGPAVTAESLLRFMKEEQYDESATLETAQAVIRSVGLLTRYNFVSLFGSYSTNPCVVKTLPPHWDEHPLHMYYISSSFHTYLTGDQVRSSSSLDMYRYVLLEGCRCLELECWDGVENMEPIVSHGCERSQTLSLRKVLEIVKQHAFVASTLPVIICLDVYNTSPEQQRVLARMLSEILDGMLAGGPMYNGTLDGHFTPKDLNKKFLIKCKQLPIKPFVGIFVANMKRGCGVKVTDVKTGSAASGAGLQTDDWVTHVNGDLVSNVTDFKERVGKLHVGDNLTLRRENISDVTFVLGGVDDASCDKIDASDDDLCDDVQLVRMKSNFHVTDTVVPELSHIVYLRAVCRPVQYVFDADIKPWEVVTRQEKNFAEDMKVLRDKIILHNSKRFCRVYPAVERVDSSNMNPVLPWAGGVQFVAQNWQTKCEFMRLYRAKFVYEGNGTGFVLKPKNLQAPGEPSLGMALSVRVIAAHNLPLKREGESPELFATMFLRGYGEDDTSAQETVSPTIRGSAWNTQFDFSQSFKVTLPCVAFLTMRVYERRCDSKHVLVAESVLPLSVLRSGYRVVQVWDEEGNLLDHDTSLFCHFVKTDLPKA
jgi:hypothetical protein